jgi:phage-related minor tail protein
MGLLANAVIVNLDADSKNLEQGFDRASKKMDEFGNKAESTGSKSGKSFVNMGDVVKGALFPLGTIMAGVGLASLKSAGEMQKMNVALETAFQGNKEEAAKASKFITDFAATTPYELAQVQGAFVKLKNMGLDPSKEAMTSYGDTASAMGKDLNDMVEAVADAATGEFERLKEFGIRSSSEGDRVKFTFKGVLLRWAKTPKRSKITSKNWVKLTLLVEWTLNPKPYLVRFLHSLIA